MSYWTGNSGLLVEYVSQSETHESSTCARVGPVAFCGLAVKTDGVNSVTLTAYDSTSASGTLLLPKQFVVPGSANLWMFSIEPALIGWAGIYIEMAGPGSFQVLYDQG